MASRLILTLALCLFAAPVYAQLPSGMPDFCASPDKTSTQSGNWNSGTTWVGGVAPVAGDIVRIAAGHTVTYNQSSTLEFECVGVASGGTLTFSTNINTKLMTAMLLVYSGGTLKIGDGVAGSCVASGNTAELVITDTALDTASTDPEQFGTGLIAVGSSIVRMCGTAKTPTWIRLAEEVSAGETTLDLAGGVCPTGWQSGDRLILPDSRHHRIDIIGGLLPSTAWGHLEELTYTSCSSGVLTVSSPAFDHPGARNMAATLEYYPHIENQTRNVIIRSENPAGVRGHTMFTDTADVDIRYAAFNALGRTTYRVLDCTLRTTGAVQGTASSPTCTVGTGTVTHIGTNHIGRYPLHIHHLTGPASPQSNGYQYTLIGNAISDASTFKWGIAIHNSHWGLIQWNTMYDIWGAQLATEDGSETNNVIEYNSAVKGTGVCSTNILGVNFCNDMTPGDPNEGGLGWVSAGRDGVGYWFRAGNNYIRNNIAANFYERDTYTSYGFKFYSRDMPATVRIPSTQGVSPTTSGTNVGGNQIPIKQFENNESYGTSNGLTYWWICAADNHPTGCTAGTLKNYTTWHHLTRGIYAYPASGMTIDGHIARGDTPGTQSGEGSAIVAGDYMQHNWILTNLNIQGYRRGLFNATITSEPDINNVPIAPAIAGGGTPITITNSYFQNTEDIYNDTPYTSGFCQQCIPPRLTYMTNVTLAGTTKVTMFTGTVNGNRIQNDRIYITNHNGVSGANYVVVSAASNPSTILAQSSVSSAGPPVIYTFYSSPVSGQTNSANWSTYGISFGGQLAPCTTTMSGFANAYVCPGSAPAKKRLRMRIR